jgi:hypothetical protein
VKKWREKYLLRMVLLFITLPLFVFSLFSFSIPYLYTLVPVYESETCWQHFLTTGSFEIHMSMTYIPCAMKITNALMFVTLNWAEIIGFAGLFWLVRDIKNELNVKREVQAVLLLWGLFSLIYFILQINLQRNINTLENASFRASLRLAIFLAIQFRNMSTLLATTMLSIYMMVRHPEKSYPKTIEGKLEALDFDLVLTSPLSF